MNKGKLVIMIITVLLLTISFKAKAYELGKPAYVSGHLCNRTNGQIDCNNTTWLQNNNINTLYFINEGPDKQERYWRVYEYNDQERIKDHVVVYNTWPGISGQEMIMNFKWAYTTQVYGDTFATYINKVEMQYNDGNYEECGIVSRGGSEFITNKTAIVSEIKCIAKKTLVRIWIRYTHNTTDYNTEQYYISEIATIRNPVSQEELLETQQQIEEGIKYQNDLIENSGWGNIDDTNVDTNIVSYIENKEQQISQLINDMDSTILEYNVDTNANNFIWTRAYEFITMKPYITTLYLGALSVGIIKLFLGR